MLSKNKNESRNYSQDSFFTLIKNDNRKIYNKSSNHAPNRMNKMSDPMKKYKFLGTCPVDVYP